VLFMLVIGYGGNTAALGANKIFVL